jgi:hypothetical protein
MFLPCCAASRLSKRLTAMRATTVMAKTAKAMAMVMAMVTAMEMAMPMMLLLSMAKMLMKTTAVIQGWQLDIDDGTTSMYVDNDGDDGNSRDGDGNSNSNGNGNNDDAAAAAIGNTVNEDDCGASRMAIG